jgi:hypothetical protein
MKKFEDKKVKVSIEDLAWSLGEDFLIVSYQMDQLDSSSLMKWNFLENLKDKDMELILYCGWTILVEILFLHQEK